MIYQVHHTQRNVDERTAIGAARLGQADAVRRLGRQAISQDAARRTCPNDDAIKNIFCIAAWTPLFAHSCPRCVRGIRACNPDASGRGLSKIPAHHNTIRLTSSNTVPYDPGFSGPARRCPKSPQEKALSSRRGKISGSETRAGSVVVKAQVPLAEMLSYANELISMTQGRGSYSMEFSHYDFVPNELAEKVITPHPSHLTLRPCFQIGACGGAATWVKLLGP